MLNLEQLHLIDTELNKESADEFVRNVIIKYSKQSADNMQKALSLIPEIASAQLEQKQNRINQYNWAYETIIGQRCASQVHSRKKGKKLEPLPFPVLIAGGVAHFPNVTCINGSPAEISFLTELVECIQSRQGFDYEDPEDWKYISEIRQCEDWMVKFIQTYIDDEFVVPKAKK